jgi:CRP/FNR family transcriptional regulator, cyclic AMP receptor protein
MRPLQYDVLRSLSQEQQHEVLAATVRRRYARDEIVFHEGDLGDSLCLVTQGRAAVQVSTPFGDVATLRLVAPGDAFGEQALVGPTQRRTATVVALEPFELRHLGRQAFDGLLAEHPMVGRLLVEALAMQVRRLNGLLLEAYFVAADVRVLHRLLDLVAIYGDADTAGPIEIPLRQDAIATMAGTTRPTVNRLLRSLQNDGIVALARNRIVVVDRAALEDRAR